MTQADALKASERAAPRGDWLLPLRLNWPEVVCQELAHARSVVRVVIARVQGSSPRECGACMLVTQDGLRGTIGGGHLEWEASNAARTLMTGVTGEAVCLKHLVLGQELGQCCGGVVDLWLQRYTRADMPWLRNAAKAIRLGQPSLLITKVIGTGVDYRIVHAASELKSDEAQLMASGESLALLSTENTIELLERLDVPATSLWIYGAGHVGQALVRVLAGLPFNITWIDSRAELLPSMLPDNVHALHSAMPLITVNTAPAGTHYLVMTHDHALDYALCSAILARKDFGWLGLIGSKSKSARFRSRLRRDGVEMSDIARLTCPIGVGQIDSKLPAAIAVSVAAQLLQQRSERASLASHTTSVIPVEAITCASEDCASCPGQRGKI